MTLKELNIFEDELTEKFRLHPVIANLDKIDDAGFKSILLQRRFHSLAFTPWYDMAINGLSNPEAISVAREIIGEEYPRNNPSHREDLVYDLRLLGIEKGDIINSTPTEATLNSLREIFEALRIHEGGELYDIKAVTALRFFGETLISIEYGKFVPRMAKMGLIKDSSRFYWPHHLHDAKKTPLHEKVRYGTHADRLATILQKLLSAPDKVAFCATIEEKFYNIKRGFYGQFDDMAVIP